MTRRVLNLLTVLLLLPCATVLVLWVRSWPYGDRLFWSGEWEEDDRRTVRELFVASARGGFELSSVWRRDGPNAELGQWHPPDFPPGLRMDDARFTDYPSGPVRPSDPSSRRLHWLGRFQPFRSVRRSGLCGLAIPRQACRPKDPGQRLTYHCAPRYLRSLPLASG